MFGYLRRLSDERYRRTVKRRRTEEIMGWICVPLIVMFVWIGWKAWDQILTDRPQTRELVLPATVGAPLRK